MPPESDLRLSQVWHACQGHRHSPFGSFASPAQGTWNTCGHTNTNPTRRSTPSTPPQRPL
eukprot:4123040-Pyramimonas_sp.AAC.1